MATSAMRHLIRRITFSASTLPTQIGVVAKTGHRKLGCAAQAELVICDCAIDITYIRLRREFVYLAVILDIYPRAIRGWELGRNLTEELSRAALERALAIGRRPEYHHSDQGVQYAANGYVARLQELGSQVSMAARGQPTENPFAERLMRTLKEEEVYLNDYADFAEARQRIGRFLDDVYMNRRVHSSLGYRTPTEFEAEHALSV